MRTIAHISDIHFGSADLTAVEGLVADIGELAPDVVAVSGELTQRARHEEFRRARAFLDSLPAPTIAVPGNHDIPFFDVYRRFLRPTRRFRHYISAELDPIFADEEVVVLGLNTARSNVLKSGRISRKQIETITHRLGLYPKQMFRVLVTHHPFIAPPAEPSAHLVGRGPLALEVAEQAGLDLILAGHTHQGYGGAAPSPEGTAARSILVFQAGTAVSARTRGETNAYNVVSIDGPRLRLEIRAWDGACFGTEMTVDYLRRGDEWLRVRTTDTVAGDRAAGPRPSPRQP